MKPVPHLVRAVLLAITLVAGATAWLFAMAPERVRAFDEAWTTRAAESSLERARDLAKEAARAPAEALDDLDRFIESHRGAERGDRAFLALRLARRVRAEASVAAGRVDEGLDEAEAFARDDARDLATRLWAGELISRHGASPERGITILRAAFQELPELGSTTRALSTAQRRAGDEGGALDTLLTHLAVSPREILSMEGLERPFDLWWSAGEEPFDAARRTSSTAAVTPLYIAVTFELPAGADRLRIDPPGGSRIAFGRSIFAVVTEAGPAQIDLASLDVESEGMTFDGAALVTSGQPDPWMSFVLPEAWRGTPMEARLVLASGRLPLWIEDAFAEASVEAYAAAVERLMNAADGIALDTQTGTTRSSGAMERGRARRASDDADNDADNDSGDRSEDERR